MTVLGTSERGKFYISGMDVSDGHGVQISIGGVADPVGSATLVTSFSADQRESLAISQCLNGGVFMYTYGHDPQGSSFSLGVTSFLNTCDGGSGTDMGRAIQVYQAGRVSQSKALSTLSVGDTALRGYLVGQQLAVSNLELSTITVTYHFIALNPQGDA